MPTAQAPAASSEVTQRLRSAEQRMQQAVARCGDGASALEIAKELRAIEKLISDIRCSMVSEHQLAQGATWLSRYVE